VAKWAAELAHQDWPGCDAAFAWSFYSQGSGDQQTASSDLFLKEALVFFGDQATAESNRGAYDKGRRLAQLCAERRSLLILDGLEPLQYAPSSTAVPPGQLKDQGIGALLKGLATASHGLCVVTTRCPLPDLKAFKDKTVVEKELKRLSTDAGVHLLQQLGVRKESGSRAEFETLVEDVKGHALTLTLLGGFLKRAFHGDIRQRDSVKFEKADEKMDGGHAFRTMAAYEQWLLRDGGDEGRREVAVLRLMGLFDRPADAGCLAALLQQPAIPNLTEPLMSIAEEDWNFSLDTLASAKLLTVSPDTVLISISAFPLPTSLDAHPLLREHFAQQLRVQQPDAWRTAHRRLYEYLCKTTSDKKPNPTLEDLQPLYQAVVHGCQSGMQLEACEQIYHARIQRKQEAYSTKKLGAFSSDLTAIICFFERPWSRISPLLDEEAQTWLLNEAGARLRPLGRLTEAVELTRAGLARAVKREQWRFASTMSANLGELMRTLGDLLGAEEAAKQSLNYIAAGRNPNQRDRILNLSVLADILHQAGRRAAATTRYRWAEDLQAALIPTQKLLSSVQGFEFCSLLLSHIERSAWQVFLGLETEHSKFEALHTVSQRAEQAIKIAEQSNWPVDAALGRLTLARTTLCEAVLSKNSPLSCKNWNPEISILALAGQHIIAAIAGLRYNEVIASALLTRAWLRVLAGARTGPGSAQEDLDEAWEIAERGPMRLFMADIHLYRARLFGKGGVISGQSLVSRGEKYPWESPAADLAAAEKLIHACGYHRRDEELADAKRAILGIP
jgi:hypothetical protein